MDLNGALNVIVKSAEQRHAKAQIGNTGGFFNDRSTRWNRSNRFKVFQENFIDLTYATLRSIAMKDREQERKREIRVIAAVE